MLAVVSVVTIFILSGCLAEKYDLKLDLEEDKIYELITKVETTSEMNIMEIKMGFELASDSRYLLNMEDLLITDNFLIAGQIPEVKIEITMDDVFVDMPSNFADVVLDEIKEETRKQKLAAEEKVRKLQGSRFSMVVDEKGGISSAEFGDFQFNDFENELSSSTMEEAGTVFNWFLGEEGDLQTEGMFDAIYGGKLFKENWDFFSNCFPEKEVAIGDSWGNSQSFKFGESDIFLSGFIMIEDEYTIKEINNEKIIFDVSNDIYFEREDSLADDYPAIVEVSNYNIGGFQEGEIIIDRESGWLLEAEIIQSMTVEITNNIMGQENTTSINFNSIIHSTGNILLESD